MAASFLLSFGIRRFLGRTRENGTTAVEMALIAPVFFLFLLGTTEISLILLTQHLMENAAYNTSRLASTGFAASGQTQQQTISAQLNKELKSLGTLIDTSKVTLSAVSYNDMSTDGGGTTGNGSGGQVVVYTITYPWAVFTPMMRTIIGDTNGKVNLSTRIVVQNEPY